MKIKLKKVLFVTEQRMFCAIRYNTLNYTIIMPIKKRSDNRRSIQIPPAYICGY